ncbi:replication initiation negative regulator SeqA [Thalassotalea fusca]
MKNIEIDEELYQYIASKTQYIGESASSIIRRLLTLPDAASDQDTATTAEQELKVTSTQETTVEENTQAPKEQKARDTAKSVFNVINKEELAMQRGAVGRFLIILSALHRVHSEDFDAVCDVRGRDRLYFADSEDKLAESGSSTKPRQIPDSPYWVITNSNTTRKKMMLTEAAKILGYSQAEIEKIRDLL